MTIKAMSFTDWAQEPVARDRRGVSRVEHSRDEVRVRAEPLDEIWWQGREWAVTSYGIEKRDGTYYIPKADFSLHGDKWSWPEHLAAKGWPDIEDFTTAWLVAMTLHGKDGSKARGVIAKLPPIGGSE